MIFSVHSKLYIAIVVTVIHCCQNEITGSWAAVDSFTKLGARFFGGYDLWYSDRLAIFATTGIDVINIGRCDQDEQLSNQSCSSNGGGGRIITVTTINGNVSGISSGRSGPQRIFWHFGIGIRVHRGGDFWNWVDR